MTCTCGFVSNSDVLSPVLREGCVWKSWQLGQMWSH